MIRWLRHNEIDRRKWDACVGAVPDGILFFRSWYLDTVCPGWHALVEDDYRAVFPVALKSRLGISYGYQPYFTRYFGVYGAAGGAGADEFLAALPRSVRYLQCGLHESNRLSDPAFRRTERRYQLLDLSADYDALHKAYSTNAVRNIRKAEKAGWAVRTDVAPETIVDLFRSAKGNELREYGPEDYRTLLALMRRCVAENAGTAPGVYDAEGRLVAAAFLMGAPPRYIYLKSGTTPEGRAGGAMHLLFDRFIRERAGTACRLDFGGSSVPSVARFYRGFGAADVVYLQITGNRLAFPFRLMKK